LKEEPDKIQLWYCLGLIYLFAHDDRELAKESLLEFKRLANERQRFLDQMPYVDNYLEKMKTNQRFE